MTGNFIMNPQLLVLAGVPVELWRVKDWAKEDASIAVLCMTLYFTRLKLFAVNAKKAGSRD
eukprot:327213-Ditylum_brightwellii.AAC.1